MEGLELKADSSFLKDCGEFQQENRKNPIYNQSLVELSLLFFNIQLIEIVMIGKGVFSWVPKYPIGIQMVKL